MNELQLQLIYQHASLHAFPTYDPMYLSLPVQKGYLWILKAELSQTEIQLLQHLVVMPHETPQSAWGNLLLQDQHYVPSTGNYRLIQIAFQQKRAVQFKKWQQAVKEFFQELVDCIVLTDHYVVLIEKQHRTSLQPSELTSLFLALDGDFDTYSKIFIGCFYPEKSHFYRLFQEEEAAFMYSLTKSHVDHCTTLAQISLAFYLDPKITSRTCLQTLAPIWIPDEATQILLKTLWQQKGNLSATAKELFMHRNTIQYQVEKFQTSTQLNLKEMNDLYFTQLLLQQF